MSQAKSPFWLVSRALPGVILGLVWGSLGPSWRPLKIIAMRCYTYRLFEDVPSEIVIFEGWLGPSESRFRSDSKTMLEQQFSKRCCYIYWWFEDVPSEIVIFDSRQGALGAILGSCSGSHFIILKRFNNDIKMMLRTSHFLRMSLAKWPLLDVGLPCSFFRSAVLFPIFRGCLQRERNF